MSHFPVPLICQLTQGTRYNDGILKFSVSKRDSNGGEPKKPIEVK